MTPAEFREAREKLGLSQMQLAAALGVSWDAIQRAEQRRPRGSLYQLMTLIQHYGRDALDVLR